MRREQVESYHHGDLSRTLVVAGLRLARTDGASAVVLREVTRRAGVSPSAAYRHFADRESLVSAVAKEALGRMAQSLEKACAEHCGGQARLAAVGRRYICFALDEPGWFDVAMFSQSHMMKADPPAPERGPEPPSAYGFLLSVIEQLVREGAIQSQAARHSATTCWASVHGFATLTVKGPLRHVPRAEVDQQAAKLVDTVVGAVCNQPRTDQ